MVTFPLASVRCASLARRSSGKVIDHQSSIIGPPLAQNSGATSTPAAGLPSGSSSLTVTCAGGLRITSTGWSDATPADVNPHGGASITSACTASFFGNSIRKVPSPALAAVTMVCGG